MNQSSSERIKSEPRNTPQLSGKEEAERRAEGRCFRCNEQGHIARNCPQGASVQHNGDKPPGVTSFNLELGAIEEAYDSSPEVLDSIPLGAIDFMGSPDEPDILSLAESLLGDPPELQPISDSEYESSEMDGLDLGDWSEHMLAACESLNAFASDLLEATDEEQIELNRVQVDRNKYPTLQRNAAQVKGKAHIFLKPLIVIVNINRHLA